MNRTQRDVLHDHYYSPSFPRQSFHGQNQLSCGNDSRTTVQSIAFSDQRHWNGSLQQDVSQLPFKHNHASSLKQNHPTPPTSSARSSSFPVRIFPGQGRGRGRGRGQEQSNISSYDETKNPCNRLSYHGQSFTGTIAKPQNPGCFPFPNHPNRSRGRGRGREQVRGQNAPTTQSASCVSQTSAQQLITTRPTVSPSQYGQVRHTAGPAPGFPAISPGSQGPDSKNSNTNQNVISSGLRVCPESAQDSTAVSPRPLCKRQPASCNGSQSQGTTLTTPQTPVLDQMPPQTSPIPAKDSALTVSSTSRPTSTERQSQTLEGTATRLLTSPKKSRLTKFKKDKGAAESFWMESVKEWYPDRHKKAHFLPPQHFNKIQYDVQPMAGQLVLVPEKPPRHPVTGPVPLYPSQSYHSSSGQHLAGKVWTQPQGPLAPLPRFQRNDMFDDAATQRVLACLQYLSEDQVMMTVSQLEFRKYLDAKVDPIKAADLFPRPDDLVGKNCDGECDLIIIHRHHGLIVGEIKSVGGNLKYTQDLANAIQKRVEKAVIQLNKAATVLRHLVSDVLANIKITKTLFLPFVTSHQLTQVVSNDPRLQKEFCHCLGEQELSEAVSQCLCANWMPSNDVLLSSPGSSRTPERLPVKTFTKLNMYRRSSSSSSSSGSESDTSSVEGQEDDISDDVCDDASDTEEDSMDQHSLSLLTEWWEGVTGDTEPAMTDHIYDQLLARFCGPATTVEVPTVTAPRRSLKKGFTAPAKVLRTAGQAVAETGLVLSTLCLHPDQVDILNDTTLHSVHLHGPPGVGKTLLLTLKASQWLHQGHDVHLVQANQNGRAVTMVIENQLKHVLDKSRLSLLETVRTSRVYRHISVNSGIDDLVTELASMVVGGQLFVISDEVPQGEMALLGKVKDKVPSVCIWCAGASKMWNTPPWMTVKPLTSPLRSPPVVNNEVDKADDIRAYRKVLPYSAPYVAPVTAGPPIRWFQHSKLDGHPTDTQGACEKCAQLIIQTLRELGVGQSSPGSLEYRDVMILSEEFNSKVGNEVLIPEDVPLVRMLRDGGVPVKALSHLSEDEQFRDVALATENAVMVSCQQTVVGLERRVVVGLGVPYDGRFTAMSRCTSQLVWIDSQPRMFGLP